MAVKVVFRCEHCGKQPDRATQGTLEGQLRDRTVGLFVDAQPGNWLIFTAGGPLGSKRYACPEHREILVAQVRRRHGNIRSLRSGDPYPSLWPKGFSGLGERELADLLAGASPATAARPARGRAPEAADAPPRRAV